MSRIIDDLKVMLYKRILHPVEFTKTSDEWDDEYTSGLWNKQHQLSNACVYSQVSSYFMALKRFGSILDVGCGEGILADRIESSYYSKYVGLDFSQVAISRAQDKNRKKAFFYCRDVRHYTPSETFDALVFSEILDYFESPHDLLERYQPFLKPDGIIIVMSHSPVQKRVFAQIDPILNLLDETKFIKKNRIDHVCKVYKSIENHKNFY